MKLEVIPTKGVLYDKCENTEQLYDNFYFPLLVEFKELQKQIKELKEENKKLKEQLTREVVVRDDIYKATHYRWNKLKEWLKEGFDYERGVVSEEFIEAIENTLDKMQEIEGGSDEKI